MKTIPDTTLNLDVLSIKQQAASTAGARMAFGFTDRQCRLRISLSS
ncbi:MAG: hypothetical protein U0894_16795 [Pirellulales bacterium]